MASPPPASPIEYRRLRADELRRVHEIDRSEVIDGLYRVRDGVLALEDYHFEARGWPPGLPAASIPRMHGCLARGGAAWGAFAAGGLVGIAVLDGRLIGTASDAVDLYFLHVSNDYRGQRIGARLVQLASARARELGATRLYVSATPSRNTVEFYQRIGFGLAAEVDDELYELEPEDIHMDMPL